MKHIAKNRLCVIHLFLSIVANGMVAEYNPVAYHYLNPQYYLNQVIDIGVHLTETLDMLKKNVSEVHLQEEEMDAILQLAQQFSHAANKVVSEESKTQYYLPDDIAHLLSICAQLEEAVMHLAPNVYVRRIEDCFCICKLVVEAKQLLHTFFTLQVERCGMP